MGKIHDLMKIDDLNKGKYGEINYVNHSLSDSIDLSHITYNAIPARAVQLALRHTISGIRCEKRREVGLA